MTRTSSSTICWTRAPTYSRRRWRSCASSGASRSATSSVTHLPTRRPRCDWTRATTSYSTPSRTPTATRSTITTQHSNSSNNNNNNIRTVATTSRNSRRLTGSWTAALVQRTPPTATTRLEWMMRSAVRMQTRRRVAEHRDRMAARRPRGFMSYFRASLSMRPSVSTAKR